MTYRIIRRFGENVIERFIMQEEAEFIADSLPASDGAKDEWRQIAEALADANSPNDERWAYDY